MISGQWRRYLVAFIVLGFRLQGMGQVNTADATGFVTDSTGAAIVGAAVEITNVSTGVQREAKTNASGIWSIPSLVPDTYSIQIVKPGFAPAKLENISLMAGQVQHLNIKMEVGASNQVVQVTASHMINVDNAQVNTTLGTRQVDLLPTNSRNWVDLVTQGNGLDINSARGTLKMDNLPSGGTSITVDGVPAEGQPSLPSFGQYQDFNLIKSVGLGAIQEVSISRGVTPADVGATMTGNVNVITKSGSNHLHGTILWLDNNTVFNARDPFSGTRLPVVRNQYVASLGGPIVRNKLFYFGDYEGYQVSAQANATGPVPTPEFRAAAEAAVPEYAAWFNLFPDPTVSYAPGALSALALRQGATKSHDNYGNLRVDYYPAPSWQAIFRYTRARPYQISPNISPENAKTYVGYTEAGSAQVLYTHGDTLYEGRFGINYNDENRVGNAFYLKTNSIRKFKGIDAGSFEALFQGGRSLTYEGKVTKQIGHHLLKVGGSFLWRLAQQSDIQAPELKYANQSDFLANIPSQVLVTYGVSLFNLKTWSIGTFLQDDWKVNDRLTINSGIRWDYFDPAHADNDRLFNRGGPYGTGPNLPPGTSWNQQWTNFSPRVGLAYQPGGSGKTVIRAGTGIFYSGHVLFGAAADAVRDSLTQPFRANFSRADVLKFGSALQFPVVDANTLSFAQDLDSSSTINQNYPNPYSVKYLLSVEQQLSQNWALHLSYVGNLGRNLTLIREINRPDRITGIRPYASLGTFNYYDAVGSSNYNSLQAELMHQFSHRIQWNLYYTWAHALAHSNEADILKPTQLQESYNVAGDYGPSDADIRNRVASNLVYQPLFSQMLGRACKPVLCDGWEIGTTLDAHSGSPFNITQSSGIAASRPDAVAGAPKYLSNYRTTRHYLNPAAFSPVPVSPVSGLPIRPGNEPRNGIYGPGYFNVDLSLAHSIAFPHGVSFRLESEMLNAFNHVNYLLVQTKSPALEITSTDFGQLTQSTGTRTIQFSGKLSF